MKQYFQALKKQYFLVCLVIMFKIFIWLNILPSESELIVLLNTWFATYGLVTVAIASFLENIVGVATYFPGSVVILTSMALTKGNIIRGVLTFLAIIIPSTTAHILNYLIGYQISKKEDKSVNSTKRLLWITLWHPYLAAITTFSLGEDRVKFASFLPQFLLAHITWNIFWAIVMFNIGKVWTPNSQIFYIFYLYLFVWIAWDSIKYFKKK